MVWLNFLGFFFLRPLNIEFRIWGISAILINAWVDYWNFQIPQKFRNLYFSPNQIPKVIVSPLLLGFESWSRAVLVKSMELLSRCSTLIPQASSLGLPNSHGKPSNFFPKLKSTLSFSSASSVLKTTALKPSRTLAPPCSVLMTGPQTPDAARRGAETDAMGLLFRERIVFLGNSIDDFVADAIMSQLLLLDAQDSTKDIRLFINSAGGSLRYSFTSWFFVHNV